MAFEDDKNHFARTFQDVLLLFYKITFIMLKLITWYYFAVSRCARIKTELIRKKEIRKKETKVE
jgi:hypothetical protein